MGIKNLKGSVSVENFKGRIRLRWQFQKKRYSLYVAACSKQNLLQAKKIVVKIEQDIATGQFDFSLNTYNPSISQPTPPIAKTIVEYFEEWVRDYRNMSCDRDIDYHSTRSMLRKWGDFTMDTVVSRLGKDILWVHISMETMKYAGRERVKSASMSSCFTTQLGQVLRISD